MNAQLEAILKRNKGNYLVDTVKDAYRVGIETAILKLQEASQTSACSACQNFLTNLANELRKEMK